jgi:hypothetical protein
MVKFFFATEIALSEKNSKISVDSVAKPAIRHSSA